jgi:hypothetical protein
MPSPRDESRQQSLQQQPLPGATGPTAAAISPDPARVPSQGDPRQAQGPDQESPENRQRTAERPPAAAATGPVAPPPPPPQPLDKAPEGGRFVVAGRLVDANGNPVREQPPAGAR